MSVQWDEPSITPATVCLAFKTRAAFCRLAGATWTEPHVTANNGYATGAPQCGEVVFEWWKAERKLTVYIKPEGPSGEVTYVQSWGPNIHTQMCGGEVTNDEQGALLWAWLTNGRLCVACSGPYAPGRTDQRYCSARCSARHRMRKSRDGRAEDLPQTETGGLAGPPVS